VDIVMQSVFTGQLQGAFSYVFIMTIKRLFKTLEKCLPPFDTFF
jgi:hypothetical protein